MINLNNTHNFSGKPWTDWFTKKWGPRCWKWVLGQKWREQDNNRGLVEKQQQQQAMVDEGRPKKKDRREEVDIFEQYDEKASLVLCPSHRVLSWVGGQEQWEKFWEWQHCGLSQCSVSFQAHLKISSATLCMRSSLSFSLFCIYHGILEISILKTGFRGSVFSWSGFKSHWKWWKLQIIITF